jgi:amino acid transporter
MGQLMQDLRLRGGDERGQGPDRTEPSYAAAKDSGELRREFTLWSTFSLAFAFISPIVALYTILALGLTTSGAAFWFGFPVVLVGQTFVALLFGMLASRYPQEGSIYQWSKRLVGERYAWFCGWAYQWALPIGMAAVTVGCAHFLAELLGMDAESAGTRTVLALLLLAFSTWGNTHGRFILNAVVGLCILAEIIASLGVGGLLLWRYQVNPLHVIWSTPHLLGTDGSVSGFFNSKVAAAVALCGWALVGFESAGSIAEEVKNPEWAVPRAIVWSLWSVGAIVSFAALSIILAIPNLEQTVAGAGGDPVAMTLTTHLGSVAFKFILVLFILGFVASMIGMQASVSRVIWAFARDDELPGSAWLKRLSEKDRLPVNAIWCTGVVSVAFVLLSLTNIFPALLACTIALIYIAYSFPVVAAACAHLRGRWQSGPFHLGWAAGPTIYLAAAWCVFETVNVSWPRSPGARWYESWIVPIMLGVLAVSGLVARQFLDRRRA